MECQSREDRMTESRVITKAIIKVKQKKRLKIYEF